MHHDSTDPRHRDDFATWAEVLGQLESAPGRAVLSHESLGKAEDADARRMVDTLGGPRVHVLAVARRLDRLLPSQWQQRVKTNATTLSYEDWLRTVLGDDRDDPVWRNLWVPHDLRPMVERWSAAAAPERFTLLVADESDRLLLSRTVERMLGLPRGLLRPEETHKTNSSLSFDRLEIIRHLNLPELSRGAPSESTAGWLTTVRRAVKGVGPVPGERRVPPLPPWARDRVVELSEARADLVERLDVRVLGDADDLRVRRKDLDEPADDLASTVPVALAAEILEKAVRSALEAERSTQQDHPTV